MNDSFGESSEITEYTFKIILIGNSGVGKTSILNKYVKNIFDENYLSTIGVDYVVKNITIFDKNVRLRIWDTVGQEKYYSTAKNYFWGSDACFLVFDLTSHESFQNLNNWLELLRNNCDNDTQNNIVILGNKCDLNEIKVSEIEIDEFNSDKHFKYFETSAKDGRNINECFNFISEKLIYELEHDNIKKKELNTSKFKESFYEPKRNENSNSLNNYKCC